MENEPKSSFPQKYFAYKLCKGAIACVLFGIFLSVFCFFLAYITRYNPDTLILFGGLLVSFTFIYFVAPIFGIFALIGITVKWKTITNPDYISSNQERVFITVNKFIIASLLFSSTVFLPAMFLFFSQRTKNIVMPILYSICLFLIALIALIMAFISYRLLKRISANISVRIGSVFSVFLGLIAMVVVLVSSNYGNYLIQRVGYSTITPTFSGSSDLLKQTIIVPTLDSPFENNKNIIWCSSFQLAWNQMKDDVIGEPIQVIGAEELVTRLNTAEQSASDMEPESFYAAAGRIKQGIVDKIKKDMADKFPSHTVPEFDIDIPEAILAYSYLIANVPFKYPYRQAQNEFFFTDSNGIKTDVGAFGAWGYGQRYRKMREQVEILFYHEDYNETNRDMQMKEFAVDLCRHSSPYQVVAAVVEPKDSLADTLDDILRKTEEFKKNPRHEDVVLLDDTDVLIVPEMFWEINHRFDELINRIVANANPPMPIIEARQGIRFKLDRYGAMLESEATIAVSAIPRYFIFNRPFLVYMIKRDCEQPFFVMWVDNAELLTKK